MNFSKLCTPALVYFVIAAFSVIVAFFQKFQLMALVFKSIFIVLYTMFLNFLCSNGYKSISWFLVLLPFVLMLIAFIMIISGLKKNSTSNTQQNQNTTTEQMMNKNMMGGQMMNKNMMVM